MHKIKINKTEYDCKSFMYHKVNNVEHLHVAIIGVIETKENKLNIEHETGNYYGFKILPRVKNGVTEFLVYIFQEGDSEL